MLEAAHAAQPTGTRYSAAILPRRNRPPPQRHRHKLASQRVRPYCSASHGARPTWLTVPKVWRLQLPALGLVHVAARLGIADDRCFSISRRGPRFGKVSYNVAAKQDNTSWGMRCRRVRDRNGQARSPVVVFATATHEPGREQLCAVSLDLCGLASGLPDADLDTAILSSCMRPQRLCQAYRDAGSAAGHSAITTTRKSALERLLMQRLEYGVHDQVPCRASFLLPTFVWRCVHLRYDT